MNAIDNKENQLSDEMYNQVLSAFDSISGKEIKEGDISYYEGLSQNYFKQLLKFYQHDSTELSIILNDLDSTNFLPAKYYQSLLLYTNDQKDNAISLLNNIMNDEYSVNYQNEIAALSSLLRVFSDSSYNLLPDFLLAENQQVVSYSRNFLIHHNNLIYHEPYEFDNGLKSSRVRRNNTESETPSKELFMKIYPNPAEASTNIIFTNELKDNCKLRLIDLLGRIRFEKGIQNQNTVYIDLNSFPKGSYIVQLLSATDILESQLITVK